MKRIGTLLLIATFISGLWPTQSLNAQEEFTCGDAVSYGGVSYPTILIGGQCWFGKNLNYGTRIDLSGNQADADGGTFQKYCYNNSEANCDNDGGLYQWHTAMGMAFSCKNSLSPSCQPNAVHQGICPVGWHVPTKFDLDTLVTEAGGASVAGGALKEVGINNWIIPNAGAKDSFDFAAYGVGRVSGKKVWKRRGRLARYWSSTIENKKRAYSLKLTSNSSSAIVRRNNKKSASSVRCIYDEEILTYAPTYNLSYAADIGGSITGSTSQTVSHNTSGSAVSAVADTDFEFVAWSDGSTNNPRTDTAVQKDISVTASFSFTGTDVVEPDPPGSLTIASQSYSEVTLNFGAATSDDNFAEYIIYYKEGSSEPSDEDELIDKTTAPALSHISYGGQSSVTLSGLVPATQYTANIWAYDAAGNTRKAASSVTFSTLSDSTPPSTPGALTPVFIGQNIVGFKLGSPSNDTFFQSYKIFIKQGSNGVQETDTEISSSTRPLLAYPDFKGNILVNLDTLSPNTEYTANIWAYDYYGNKSSSPTEVTFTTQDTDIVKATRDNISFTVLDSALAAPVPGYGNSTESTSRVQLQKSIAYTNSSSLSDTVAVVIPANTIMTTKSVGDLETTTDFSTMTLGNNPNVSTLPVPPAGKLSFGFDDKKVELSNPITLTMDTPGVADGTELMVYSKDASQGNWTRLTLDGENVNCTVSSQTCSFQTKHLSEFGGGDPDVPVGGVPEFSTYVYTLLFLLFGYMLHQKMPEYLGEARY